MIVNFRNKVGELTQPFSKGVSACNINLASYLRCLQESYRIIFLDHGHLPPSPFDRTNFYLDDNLAYKEVNICSDLEGDHLPIVIQVLLPMISPSRVFSFSMFIEPIFWLRNRGIEYYRLIKVAFYGSLLNTPYWYYHIIGTLVGRLDDPNDTFKFRDNPMLDILEHTINTFGKWQTSICKRYSPAGGEVDIPKIFGVDGATGTENTVVRGRQRLDAIVNILVDYTIWIDEELAGKGWNPEVDMPLPFIKRKMEDVLEKV